MMAWIAGSALLVAGAQGGGAATPVSLRDEETIVFFGDSITEQNLYTAYLETFLVSRFPEKKLAFFNFGWGGDTASGGVKRFARDVAPVKPTLVFVNFGMNDGGYKEFQAPIYERYLANQRELAGVIAAAGAREVLFTTSPVDPSRRSASGDYNEMLDRMAQGISELGRQRNVPVIDLLHPMLAVQRQAKERTPGFTMIPDGIHPDPVGHLVMAYVALQGIEGPRIGAELRIAEGVVREARGASVTSVRQDDASVELDLGLPFLPFYVPPEARPALALVPFEKELNRFQLVAELPNGLEKMALTIDGRTAGVFSREELARGIDLALLDRAPWAVAGRRLWDAAQLRWTKHAEAWRRMGIEKPEAMLPGLRSFEDLARAQRAYADELGRSLAQLARPGTYRLSLRPEGAAVRLDSVELSPVYSYEAFDTRYPPEKDPDAVAWRRAAFDKGQIDLGKEYDNAMDVVAYARVQLEADRACPLHLALGSDDGLAVFLNGKRIFAHDVLRGLTPGEDEAEAALAAGRNELLFKVTQAGGDFALAVDARVRGRATVTQIGPR
jgi:lysophospholipase L1-like esterase